MNLKLLANPPGRRVVSATGEAREGWRSGHLARRGHRRRARV